MSDQLWGTWATSCILPFHSWRLYRALLSWPTSARSWGHLRKCQFCFLMLRSWPGRERRGVNRVQPTTRCASPHIETPNTSVCSARSHCHGVLRAMLTHVRGLFVCLRELNPSVLQSRLTRWQWSLGCATRKRRRDRCPQWTPATSVAQSWLLEVSPAGMSGPHGVHSFLWHSSTQLRAPCRPAARSRHHPGGLSAEPGLTAAEEKGWRQRRAALREGCAESTPTPHVTGSPGLHLPFCSAKHRAAPVSGRAGQVTGSRSNKLGP